jgi:hypothetical protein
MRVKCGARRGEGEDEGACRGGRGRRERRKRGGDEWSRGEVDRNRDTQRRSLSEGKTYYRALKVSKARCVYEPKLLRLFWELIGKCAGLTMSMKEEEADEIWI